MKLPGVYPYFYWMEEDKYQTCWITSDTHFGDEELRAGISGRPSDEEIFRKLKSKVGKNDVLIHLGDVGNLDYIKKLKGYKILIMGNHDAGRTNYERKTIVHRFDDSLFSKEEVKAEMEKRYPGWDITILGSKEYSFRKPFVSWVVIVDNNLFDEVYEGPLMLGEKLILSHEPMADLTWAMNLHGHIHDKQAKTDAYHINCCSDVVGYEPINLTQKLKQGITARIISIHRQTINRAIERKSHCSTHLTNTVKNC